MGVFLQLVRIPWDCMNGFISTFKYFWHKIPFAFLIEHFKKSTKNQQTCFGSPKFLRSILKNSPLPGKQAHLLLKAATCWGSRSIFPPSPGCRPEVGHWRVAFLALPRRWWRWYSWLWNLGENNRWAMTKSRWWFQTFVIFTLTWGNDPIWQISFKWVETTNQKKAELFSCFFGGWNRKPNFFLGLFHKPLLRIPIYQQV